MLKNNQILITLSKDGKTTTIQVGSLPEVSYSSCPNKPYEQIQNSINSYVKEFGLQDRIEEFEKKGCFYENSGKCMDCN